MIIHNEWLIVGLITSPQGINGKVKIKSLSDFEERFTKPGKRWIQKGDEIPSRDQEGGPAIQRSQISSSDANSERSRKRRQPPACQPSFWRPGQPVRAGSGEDSFQ